MDLLEILAAERDIRRQIALYGQFADDRDVDAWVGMFAETAVMVVAGKRLEGHAMLQHWITTVLNGPKMRHLMTNANIAIETPTTASVTLDALILRAEGSRWGVMAAPRYVDKWVHTAGGWRILERTLDMRAPV